MFSELAEDATILTFMIKISNKENVLARAKIPGSNHRQKND
jgi:hypothetical protein